MAGAVGARRTARKARRPVRFTATRKARFLAKLGEVSNVAAACRAAGVTDVTVYRHRQTDPAFRDQWAAALCEGYATLEITMLERAIKGVAKQVKGPDGSISEARDYSDRLALGLLAMHRKSVDEARALAGGASDGEPDAVDALIAQIDEMATRLAGAAPHADA